MATNEMLMGLLKTPSQVRKEAEEKLAKDAFARSQQMITRGGSTALPGIISSYGAQAAQRGTMAGAGLLRGISGGLGQAVGGDMGQRIADLGVSAAERQARAGQEAITGIKYNDPASIRAAAQRLQAINPQAAMQLEKTAMDVELKQSAEKRAQTGIDLQVQAGERAEKSQKMAQEQFEYQQGRDAIGDKRYVDETQYNKQRDIVSDERNQKDYDLREANAQLQSKNLELQQQRLNNLIKREDEQADITKEDRLKVQEARDNYADYLESLTDNADAKRIADLVRNGVMTPSEAEERLFPQSSRTAAGDREAIRNANAQGRIAEIAANKSRDLAARYLQEQPTGGFLGGVYEGFKSFVGGQDEITRLKTNAENLINSGIVASLPPGPASDKDIAIMSKGFPNSNWNANEIAEWMLAYSRIKSVEAQYQNGYAQWLSDNGGDSAGYDQEFHRRMQTQEAQDAYGAQSGQATPGNTVSFDDALRNAQQAQTRATPRQRGGGR